MAIGTYQFSFKANGSDSADVEQFDAESYEEADELFSDYLRDENISFVTSKMVYGVYNADDADYYGSDYEDNSGMFYKYEGREQEVWLPPEVEYIYDFALRDNHDIEKVHLPLHTTDIGIGAFINCYKLKDIEFPQTIIRIKESAFENCTSLESISIPNGVTELELATFAYCRNLKNIELPYTLKSIGNIAFKGCDELYSLYIPESCEYIADNAFNFTPIGSGLGRIYCIEGSYAEEYARSHDIRYTACAKAKVCVLSRDGMKVDGLRGITQQQCLDEIRQNQMFSEFNSVSFGQLPQSESLQDTIALINTNPNVSAHDRKVVFISAGSSVGLSEEQIGRLKEAYAPELQRTRTQAQTQQRSSRRRR